MRLIVKHTRGAADVADMKSQLERQGFEVATCQIDSQNMNDVQVMPLPEDEPTITEKSATASGMPLALAMFLMIAMFVAGAVGGYCRGEAASNPKDASDLVATKANIAIQQRIQDMQQATLKACTERGGLPIFVNGNVDCRK